MSKHRKPEKDLAPLFRPYVGQIVGHPILNRSAAEIAEWLRDRPDKEIVHLRRSSEEVRKLRIQAAQMEADGVSREAIAEIIGENESYLYFLLGAKPKPVTSSNQQEKERHHAAR